MTSYLCVLLSPGLLLPSLLFSPWPTRALAQPTATSPSANATHAEGLHRRTVEFDRKRVYSRTQVEARVELAPVILVPQPFTESGREK